MKKLQWEVVIPPAWVESVSVVVMEGDHKETSHPGYKNQHFNLETPVMQGYFHGARREEVPSSLLLLT